MKNSVHPLITRSRLVTGFVAILLLAVQPARAVNYYWDADADGAGNLPDGTNLGSTGTWQGGGTPLSNWWVSGGADTTFVNSITLSDAFFTGTPGTVTLASSAQTRTLTFSVDGYTVNATSSNTLTLGAGNATLNTISVTTGTANIGGPVFGNSNTVIAGAGSLNLTGNFNRIGGSATITNNLSGAFTMADININSDTVTTRNIVFKGTGDIAVTGVIANGNGDVLAHGMQKTGTNTATLSGLNTYTGASSLGVASALVGTLSINTIGDGGVASSLGASSNAATNLNLDGGTLRYTGATASTNRNFTLTADAGGALNRFEVSNAATALTFTGGSTGAGTLDKLGAGTLALNGTNAHTGATSVTAGTLSIGADGTINSSTGVTVAAGARFIYNNSTTALTPAVELSGAGTGSRAMLSGSGNINSALTLDNLGDTLAPGNSPGILNFAQSQNWASFSYDWETNNFAGTTAGTDFDQIAITGGLTLSGGLGAYQLNLLSLTGSNISGDVINFSETPASWTVLTTTGGITGFSADNWTLDTSGFSTTPAFGGSFVLGQVGNDLVLSYSAAAIPEPSTYAAVMGMLAAGCLVWRRRRTIQG